MGVMSVECLAQLKAPNEGLECVSDVRDRVVEFLVDVDDRWFPRWTTCSIVEAKHVVSAGRTAGEVDANGRVPPLFGPEVAAEGAEQRVTLGFANGVDA